MNILPQDVVDTMKQKYKASSCQESNLESLAWAASILLLSYNNQTTTTPSQPSVCSAQVILNASVTHPAVTQYVSSTVGGAWW